MYNISNFHRNILGTLSFDLKLKGWRKIQDFSVYPMHNEQSYIKIQSSTRIGTIDLETGKGKMSQSHSSGAYFAHLSMDKLTEFNLNAVDLQTLKMQLFTTAGKSVGNSVITTDNSGTFSVI